MSCHIKKLRNMLMKDREHCCSVENEDFVQSTAKFFDGPTYLQIATVTVLVNYQIRHTRTFLPLELIEFISF